jgi:hypothetical protein
MCNNNSRKFFPRVWSSYRHVKAWLTYWASQWSEQHSSFVFRRYWAQISSVYRIPWLNSTALSSLHPYKFLLVAQIKLKNGIGNYKNTFKLISVSLDRERGFWNGIRIDVSRGIPQTIQYLKFGHDRFLAHPFHFIARPFSVRDMDSFVK